jgi:hypothetical protein
MEVGETVVQGALAIGLMVATFLVRRRSTGRLPDLRFWMACLVAVVTVTVGTTVKVSGVLLAVPAVAVAGFVILRGGWWLGDAGLFLMVLGMATAVAYLAVAALDPDTGSSADQGAVLLVIAGGVVCLAAMAWSELRMKRARAHLQDQTGQTGRRRRDDSPSG